MSRNDKHGILLNLEPELHAAVVAAAKLHSVSNSEYIRQAIKAKLDKPKPAEFGLFDREAEDRRAATEALIIIQNSIQTSDKTDTEYWLERIRQWAGMPGAEAMAQLDAATGGVRPPVELFGSAPELAKWLKENAKQ